MNPKLKSNKTRNKFHGIRTIEQGNRHYTLIEISNSYYKSRIAKTLIQLIEPLSQFLKLKNTKLFHSKS